jgi:hypothetical protein
MQADEIDLSLELNEVFRQFQGAIREAAAVALCDARSPDPAEEVELPPASALLQLGPSDCELARSTLPLVIARYAVLAMFAITELFAADLVLVARAARAFAAHPVRTLSGEELEEIREDVRARVRGKRLATLARHALEAVGMSNVELPAVARAASLTLLADCLARRGGIVSDVDGRDGSLRVAWLCYELRGDDDIANQPLEPSSAQMKFEARETTHEWPVGEPVMLSATDCVDLSLNLLAFGHEMVPVLDSGIAALFVSA